MIFKDRADEAYEMKAGRAGGGYTRQEAPRLRSTCPAALRAETPRLVTVRIRKDKDALNSLFSARTSSGCAKGVVAVDRRIISRKGVIVGEDLGRNVIKHLLKSDGV